jgi:hypothetical protein
LTTVDFSSSEAAEEPTEVAGFVSKYKNSK